MGVSISRLHFFLLITLLSFPHHHNASTEYSRPHPRPIIFTSHTRSESDPQQVHVSLVGQDHMRVSWITSHKHTKSMVEYGKSSGTYEASATGDHTSYHYFFYSSGEIHHVVIGPLEPSTTYYYRCGGSGPEFSLRTPPSDLPIEFVVVGEWFLLAYHPGKANFTLSCITVYGVHFFQTQLGWLVYFVK